MDVLTHDFEDILNDDEVKIVAEVMGGLHPAYGFTRRCLEAGKECVLPTRNWWLSMALN